VSTLPEFADLHATKVASPMLYIGLRAILPALLSTGRDFAIKTTARLEGSFRADKHVLSIRRLPLTVVLHVDSTDLILSKRAVNHG
jgi:hypothetical protein